MSVIAKLDGTGEAVELWSHCNGAAGMPEGKGKKASTTEPAATGRDLTGMWKLRCRGL